MVFLAWWPGRLPRRFSVTNRESVMGTENNATYLTRKRERGHILMLVITAESKLSLPTRTAESISLLLTSLFPREAVVEQFKRNWPWD